MEKNIKEIASCVLAIILLCLTNVSFSADSQYEQKVTLPACDASNPKVQFIKTQSDWKSINDKNKQIFCVSPGDYASKLITLKQSGTKDEPRYIVLNNGNNIHPGKLDKTQQANVHIAFSNAHYWVVDRMAALDIQKYPIRFRSGSTNNTINRALVLRFSRGIRIHENSHGNTIQNSRVGNMQADGLKADKVCISLIRDKLLPAISINNTRIINNEIFNCNDGFQAVRHPGAQLANYAGTIVDNNDIYNTPTMFSDCNGNRDPNGKCACAEEAIDIKAGSDDANNPMVITHNRMWGYQATDTNCGGSGGSGPIVSVHYGVKSFIFENNLLFNSAEGFIAGDKGIFEYALSGSSISDNVFYKIGIENSQKIQNGTVVTTLSSNNLTIKNNRIIGSLGSWLKVMTTERNKTTDSLVSCNIIINALSKHNNKDHTVTISSNTFFNTPRKIKGEGDKVFSKASDAKFQDISFTTDRYTNNPRDIILIGAVPSEASPRLCSRSD